MGDASKTSPCVPSTCTEIAILSLAIIPIIATCQINVATDNPALIPSVCCLDTNNNFWNYVCVANDVCHAEILQSNSCWCNSHLYTFQDGIQVTRVFRYCRECQS
jgi:hypothetical protein